MKPVPHGEPYAGKLHVRFDEGAGVPHGASRSTLHPRSPLDPQSPLCIPNTSVYSVTAVGRSVCSVVKSGGGRTDATSASLPPCTPTDPARHDRLAPGA